MDFKNTGCHNGDQLHLSHAWHQLWILVNTAIVKFFKKHKISWPVDPLLAFQVLYPVELQQTIDYPHISWCVFVIPIIHRYIFNIWVYYIFQYIILSLLHFGFHFQASAFPWSLMFLCSSGSLWFAWSSEFRNIRSTTLCISLHSSFLSTKAKLLIFISTFCMHPAISDINFINNQW